VVKKGLAALSFRAAHRKEARAAKNGTTLRRIERDSCLLTTLGAVDRDFYALTNTRSLRGRDSGEAFVFCLFAGLAAFGLILESLVMKKDLLAGGPDKFLTAVNAMDHSILKLDLALAPVTVCLRFCDLYL
jgi:hypothetical protein